MIEAPKNAPPIEDQLREHGTFASNTVGKSMEPLFRTHRDMIIVKRAEGELKKYDVALYKTPEGKYILHRVIAVKESEYLIRGDNTYTVEHVKKDAVLAVLVAFNRAGKRHGVEETGYKIYSRIWNFIYPVRKLINLSYRALAKIYRCIFKRKNK